jgi:ribonuclease HII
MSSRIKKIRDSKRLSDERKEVLVKALKDRQNVLIGKGNVAMSGID